MRGTATTFATKAERGEVSKIERLMGVKFQRRAVTADIPREVRGASAPADHPPKAPSQPHHGDRKPKTSSAPHHGDRKPQGTPQPHHGERKPKVKSPWQRKFAKPTGAAKRTFKKRHRA
jgi:hypothetical protein